MLYPLTFQPIFKERVWGNRRLEQLYGKPLPKEARIGESWEVSDHNPDISIVANGALQGKDLHWLVTNHRSELLGSAKADHGRFPLLVKILDAREKLSLQVHPPPQKAAQLGGEPKTEMWYVADAAPDAELYVGLKKGVSRQDFENRIKKGSVAECFHRIRVRAGDAMFLPSGRVHALGAGLVIFEIQQNSDTTYRVFDWNRVGLDGKPRALHIEKSLASINFDDFEPSLIDGGFVERDGAKIRLLVKDSLFTVEVWEAQKASNVSLPPRKLQIIATLTGTLEVQSGETMLKLAPGQFCMIPACLENVKMTAEQAAKFLRVET